MNIKAGYFIKEDNGESENELFGILDAEATYMDPQQRKLEEVALKCFESAGVTRDYISGSDAGVYVCHFSNDGVLMQTKDQGYVDHYNVI